MQAALKFFDFPFKSAGGQGADKIGIKLPGRKPDQRSGDENGFMEIMAALTRIPSQEIETSLAQLDWVPVEDSAGEFAPLIDLTDQANVNHFILQMLLLQQGTDTQAPPLPSQRPVGQADVPIDPGKNISVPEMIKTLPDAAVQQLSVTADGQGQQAQEGPPRAVPTQVMHPNGTSGSELPLTACRNGEAMPIAENDEAVDQNTVLPTSKNARLVLADRAAETARQIVEHPSSKSITEPVPLDRQPLHSNTLKEWLGSQAPVEEKQLSGGSLGRQAVTDHLSSTAQPFQAESLEHPVQQERIQQNDRFVSTVSNRQAALAQKVESEAVVAAQEADWKSGEKAGQQPLHRAVRIDASTVMREDVITVKPSEGSEMQMNGNSSRDGAPSFDTQLSTTAPKVVEASAAQNETTPFVGKDTQTDVIRQIVQRMTLRSDRRQSQMVIRLKPDYLGNVRLHVTTEGQQVMVRMDAESIAVKEIVEQNMAHLKAELHQHGLHIEKFDVFVGNNNGGGSSGQQQAGFQQASRHSGQPFKRERFDDESLDPSGDSDNHGPRTRTTGTSEVDYFV